MSATVVVVAYNRPSALRRLLDSLGNATYAEGSKVPLVISIDREEGPNGDEVRRIASEFDWRLGPKEVIEQPVRLGLVEHFRSCGRLTQRYGDIVLLEDDLEVAPPFHDFATQVLARYRDDPRVAGLCLYGLWFNGFTQEPFLPLADGADVFFLRLPYTQGLAFSPEQWRAFDEWWSSAPPGPHPDLPDAFQRFGGDEWFPALAYYLAAHDRYFCFPRVSLTAGWGDAGSHFGAATSWFQTPIELRSRRYELPALDDSLAVYDSFFELLPDRLKHLAPALAGLDFDVDLNAAKEPRSLRHDLVLTTRPVRRAESSFGLQMYPPELNVVRGVPGDEISLARREDVHWDGWAAIEARRRLHAYAWAKHRPSRRRSVLFLAARAMQSLRERLAR